MIYATIIIIALAIAFVILIRRLPEAVTRREQAKLVTPAAPALKINWSRLQSLRAPKIALPKFPSLRLPKFKKPAPTEEPVVKAGDEFWQGANVAPPIVEEEQPETVEQKIEAVPIKTSRKDLTQEAEDLFAIRDYRRAEKAYLRLATQNPRDAKVYSRLGIIYLEEKEFEDARDALQQAIKLEPTVASRHFNLSLAYLNIGSYAKAISSMEIALKYDPSNRKYRKMLDDILAKRV